MFDQFALFFHDRYGGDVITVLLRPGVYDAKKVEVILFSCNFVIIIAFFFFFFYFFFFFFWGGGILKYMI